MCHLLEPASSGSLAPGGWHSNHSAETQVVGRLRVWVAARFSPEPESGAIDLMWNWTPLPKVLIRIGNPDSWSGMCFRFYSVWVARSGSPSLAENLGEFRTLRWKIFLDRTSTVLALKPTDLRNFCTQLKRFCTTKETINRVTGQPRDREKVFINSSSDVRLISRVCKEHKQQQQNKWFYLEWGNDVNRHLSKEQDIREC